MARGQVLSNWRHVRLPVSDTLRLDTLSIVPGSLLIRLPGGDSLLADSYIVDFPAARLVFVRKPDADTILADFRVFLENFVKPVFHKDPALITEVPEIIGNPFVYNPSGNTASIFDFGGLDYNGSFARGLSFGNAQDVVLNSSFNLQLSGNLGGGLMLRAAMTDNNLPIQPEGNTQQIQDFDKVYITLEKGTSRLTAGDFELFRPKSYFMNFNKKLLGAHFSTTFPAGENGKNTLELAGAMSKGIYARNSFMGQEGNQGPYRLKGNNGEAFIIVLAGTERVYMDGELLTRGSDYDYVIDYNLGEITFTPNRLVTKDKRIEVEFEYSVQNYFRSMLYASEQWQTGAHRFHFNIFNEQDSKNQPVVQELDSLSRKVLFQAGDDPLQAVLPGWDSTGFDPNQKMYRLVDTTVGFITYDSVWVYSRNPDSAVYRVSFAFVGPGKGNYRIKPSAVNGRVYEWVAPVAGVSQGEYAPVRVLIPPDKRQLMTLGWEYTTRNDGRITAELALSDRDPNTFSPRDDQDNRGLGLQLGWDDRLSLRRDSLRPLFLTTHFAYEYAASRFAALDNYRDIEFNRNWNLPSGLEAADEHLGELALGLRGRSGNFLEYGLGTYQRPGQYAGYRHRVRSYLRKDGFSLNVNTFYLRSGTNPGGTSFLRPDIRVKQVFKNLAGWRLEARYLGEDSRQWAGSDTLLPVSFRNNEWWIMAGSPDTGKTRMQFSYKWRSDLAPAGTGFALQTTAGDFSAQGAWMPSTASRLTWTMTYRSVNVQDTGSNIQSGETYLGRIQYNARVWKGLLNLTSQYEAGSGQEQKREFSYLKVPAGQGNYIWNDDGDGVEELDEFEPASPSDLILADYLRILTPTNEFIKANNMRFSQVIRINPKSLWHNQPGLRGLAARFSDDFVWQIEKKVLASAGTSVLNPFILDVADSALVSINSLFRNSFYFNRTNRVFSAWYNLSDLRNKLLLTNGPESKRKQEQSLQVRWNLSSSWTFQGKAARGRELSAADFLSKRNYDYRYTETQAVLTWLSGLVFRVNLQYDYADKVNLPEFGNQETIMNRFSTEARYNAAGKSSLVIRFSWASVAFDGDPQSALGYSMLKGLQPGSNLLWNITFEKKLANSLQISLSYDGRKTGSNRMIHIGSAQIRALF